MLVLRGVFRDTSRNVNHNGAEVALRGDGTGLSGASVDRHIAHEKKTTDLNGSAFGLTVLMTNDAPGSTQSRVSYDRTGKIAISTRRSPGSESSSAPPPRTPTQRGQTKPSSIWRATSSPHCVRRSAPRRD